MDAETKLQHQKNLAKIRAKKYYQKNRDKILARAQQ
jgi:hypothetical protein